VVYYASGKSNEYIVVENNNYKRYLPNGFLDVFSKQGRLSRSVDKFGGAIDIFWQPQSIRIINNVGYQLTLFLDSKVKKVHSIKLGKKQIAKYKYKNENLVFAQNFYREKFIHKYDKFHNLIQTVYPDKTQESLIYNVNKDWVIGFNDRRNCNEKYVFAKNPKNKNHYFANVEKSCGRKIVNKSKYEFWNKTLSNGTSYLHRARAVVNGRLKTDIVFHPKFGTPVSLVKNGVRTNRFYYANGFLKRKEDPFKIVEYKNYIKRCGKPEMVQLQYKNPQTKKIVKTETIKIKLTDKCLLSLAAKSRDEWIKVTHNAKGLIVHMEDQSRKSIQLRWHKTIAKPEFITRKGVGSIQIVYNAAGEVVDVKSGKNSGPTVITQVSSVFNSFLQILSPVAEEMVIL